MNFNELNLSEPILRAIEKANYTTPTPIQQEAIPILLDGYDLLGTAQTGTGKTAAFSIPIIQRLTESMADGGRKNHIKALVLTPTRELAVQIDESFAAYGCFSDIRHTVIYGGVSQVPQVEKLRRGTDVLVATPGRLLDLVNQGYVSLGKLEYFVLDEADRMLDMGFIHDIRRIVAMLPSRRQTLLFSATMPDEISRLAASLLTDPRRVEVTPQSSTVDVIEQSVYFAEKMAKRELIIKVLTENNIDSALIFARTKHGSDRIARSLNKAGITADAIHGDKSQNARQRALNNFKDRKIKVLIATDIAARGIDIDLLTHVINYDLPNIPETYVHRIGRTGRAGNSGVAISFCSSDEVDYLKDIERLIRKRIPVAGTFVGTNPEPVAEEKAEAPKSAKPSRQARAAKSSEKPETRTSRPKPDNRNRPRGGGKSGFRGGKSGGHR